MIGSLAERYAAKAGLYAGALKSVASGMANGPEFAGAILANAERLVDDVLAPSTSALESPATCSLTKGEAHEH